jgi:hypothetical protein
MERKTSQVNIAFLQISGDDKSPINCIENLAADLYNAEFCTAAMARGNKYHSPDKMKFLHLYPTATACRREVYTCQIDLGSNKLMFVDPEWDHLDTVPYVFRKQAATDGLAKDPDAPKPKWLCVENRPAICLASRGRPRFV